ncbi:TniQ family protein [Halomonas glaciei]|uniref:TniQ family protein n=1 Tax=Vreelandella glaciei TaxID=186761 RepID=A0A7Z0LQ92_9GAMM|nr:TniQ family protein [Halomonas glaciei]NYS76586.1 TniQ family protein [Halomonas glaciei]
MPWTLRVPLLADEALSSWLAKAALRQGCDPLALTGAIWPGWRVWTRDIDRGIPDARLDPLVQVSGIPASDFEQAALRGVYEQISGHPLAENRSWPWLLALGTRNRVHHGGQQFCSLCLTQDITPYFRRAWRMAWHVGCPLHDVLLLDACPTCHAPIEPHRLVAEDKHIAQCARCKLDWRHVACTPISQDALRFQQLADEVLQRDHAVLGDKAISASEWFAVNAFLLGVIRRASRWPASELTFALQSLGISVTERLLPVTGLSFELLPVSERSAMLTTIQRMLDIGLDEMFEAFHRNEVMATALHDPRKSPPEVIRPMMVNGSPRQKTSRGDLQSGHQPKSERAVRAAWARLKRRMKTEMP